MTHLEGNGKVAEKSLPTNVSLVNYLPGLTLLRAGLFCAALKMAAAAQWLEGLPMLQTWQGLDCC